MICNKCGFDNADGKACKACGSILSIDDDSKGAHFVIGKNHDEVAKGKKDISSFDGSVAAASNDFYKNKKKKKKADKGRITVWIVSVILIILVLLSCGYILIDSLNRNKIPTVTREDADAILTAFEGPALAKIKDKFRAAESDSGRESARKQALSYFNSLEEMETIESVELSQDGSKIYFKRSYTECVFVMDDPTPDTYNASTILTDDLLQSVDGTFSADRDLTNFKHGIENNVLIISATENHRSVYDKLDSMLYYFEDATLNVNYIKNATLHNFTKDLARYNAIFIHAQSFIGKDGKTVIALNEKATSANMVGYSQQLANGQSMVCGNMMSDGASYTVTDTLIKQNYKKESLPNSLVYMSMDSGYGPGNATFAKAFSAIGAQAVVGYSNKVSAAYESACVKDFAEYIILGKTIDDAYQYVITKNGESDNGETPAYFGYYGPSDWSLYGWELSSGTESTQITNEDELFDTLNYAMLSLGTNSMSQSIEGYRVLDADKDGSKELFMMAKMDGELTTNLAFDTFNNAQIALDTSKSEDYDFRTLYDSANTQIYLCEQFTNDNNAKTLYTWTNMGWDIFARYSDEKAGKPTFVWDGKNISEAAFNANFQKVSQGALMSNWRSMLNLYYQTADRNKTINDIADKFKTMSGVTELLAADFDGDNSNEAAIVISGFGNEWLKNVAIMSRTGKEPILYAQNFGTFVIYIDETDVGVVFRVVYLGANAYEEVSLAIGESGGVEVYSPNDMKTINIKFNGEVTDTAGFTLTEKHDYTLKGVWEMSGISDVKITFDNKDGGIIYAENYSFKTAGYEKGVFKHEFFVTDNTIQIILENNEHRTFFLQWTYDGNTIGLTDQSVPSAPLRILNRIDKFDPNKVPSVPDSSSSEPESSGSSSETESPDESSSEVSE
ncbi:MAG: hypothetical protein IIW73_08035 [Clostridia bacterium]|nr:hypothetical protein [Clostridia bacterium]